MRATVDKRQGMTREPRLGIDIGRVIIAGDGISDATGTFEASKPGGDHDTALRWLAGRDFYGRTGVPPEHVRFCRARASNPPPRAWRFELNNAQVVATTCALLP